MADPDLTARLAARAASGGPDPDPDPDPDPTLRVDSRPTHLCSRCVGTRSLGRRFRGLEMHVAVLMWEASLMPSSR